MKRTDFTADNINLLLDTFDDLILFYAKLEHANIIPLPKSMRLTEYILSNKGPFVSISNDIRTYASPSRESSIPDMNNKTVIGTNQATLEHRVHTTANLLLMESLQVLNEEGEDDPQVILYSGNSTFFGGHDCNDINKVGSVIFVKEDFFTDFLSRHKIDFDASKYNLGISTYELTITPVFDVNEDNFSDTLRNIVGLTNQILKIIETNYDKHCEYIKLPKMKVLSEAKPL